MNRPDFKAKDTLHRKMVVQFVSIGKIDEDNLKQIRSTPSKYKLNPAVFQYAVEFRIADCTESFYIPSCDLGNIDKLSKLKKGDPISLQVIFYKNLLLHGRPFCYIRKAEVK